MKKILVAILVFVTIIASLDLWNVYASPDTPGAQELILEFNDQGDLDAFRTFVNVEGGIESPPANGADIRVEDGNLRLEISPVANFDELSKQWIKGQAAADAYNNIFGLTRKTFSPTKTEDVVVEWRAKTDAGYQGSQELWLESSYTFEENGYMRSSLGFPGAFGLSWTSLESDPAISGLKFMYVLGFAPICTLEVEGVDPYEWNTFKIVWSKGGRFTAYANDQLVGKCTIPIIAPDVGEAQVWADQYLVERGLKMSYQNPTQTQGILFDWIRIYTTK